LNYYAAFTETRFSSSSTLNYKWSNDPNFTLDISFFPEFRGLWLDKLSINDKCPLEILPRQFKIEIPLQHFKQKLAEHLETTHGLESLKASVSQERDRQSGEGPDILDEHRIFLDGIRGFNLGLRKTIDTIIKELQKDELSRLENEYKIDKFPPPSFNLRSFTQEIYDRLQSLAQVSTDEADYFEKLKEYFVGRAYDLTLFDLYHLLKNYAVNEAYGTVYLFFDSLRLEKTAQNNNEKPEYPLFFIEVNFDSGTPDVLRLNVPRDIVLLNTPAINSFEFKRVLTLPRASSFKESISHLKLLDDFLKTEYTINQQDIAFNDNFFFFPAPIETLPLLKYRLGFQVIKNEDKRLLDYSELMTRIEKGLPSKIGEFVDSYVNSNVVSTVDEAEKSFKERYPTNSPKYYLADNPLPLNTAQKKILIALANSKNKIIAVGGPPGTGKSHAIAAITYWANQNNKSAIITSHKKEALDVVDRMLTDKFKSLHPHAKPSIIRLTRSYDAKKIDSLNAIDNSLSLPAIDAATARVSEFQPEVIESDRNRIEKRLEDQIARVIEGMREYPEKTKALWQYLILEEELRAGGLFSPEELGNISASSSLSKHFEILQNFINHFSSSDFANVSLKSFTRLYQRKPEIPGILEACERINRIALTKNEADKIDVKALSHFESFKAAIHKLVPIFDDSISLSQLGVTRLVVKQQNIQEIVHAFKELRDIEQRLKKLLELGPKRMLVLPNKAYSQEEQVFRKDYPALSEYWHKGKFSLKNLQNEILNEINYIESLQKGTCYKDEFVYSFLREKHDFLELENSLKEATGLKYKGILNAISLFCGKEERLLSLKDITIAIEKIDAILKYSELIQHISAFQKETYAEKMSYIELFTFLDRFKGILDSVNPSMIQALNSINEAYALFLNKLGIDFNKLETLFKVNSLIGEEEKLFKFIKLHALLSSENLLLGDIRQQIDEYNRLNQRLAEYQNDLRLKNLQNYHGDVERIKLLIQEGKRLTPEHAKILLSNFSCIIAEPEALFKHLPMEEDLIDILIFDEASQVSIAHSISLILRAKQVVVFGDKYQYGAVSAVNVSKRYAGSYFKNIMDSYMKECQTQISPDVYEKIIEEEGKDIPEEDQFIPDILKVSATQTWIKTFSIRNSTLTFCEAIANYHTSLTEHFRSFKEIIDYSNEYFYKKAQIPLIINRLRTKPIGEVLRFIRVQTQGNSGRNVNIDELEAIRLDIEGLVQNGFSGTIGVITSFREQQQQAERYFREKLNNYHRLKQDHKLTVWFVGDVQGEERDVVYYSFVQDKKLNNGDLTSIYPIPNGVADDIRSLKMQRLNVGFSRAKDTMVFVHSMNIEDYADSRLGDALKFYWQILQETKEKDHFISDEKIFESPKEKELYNLLTQTEFFQKNKGQIRIVPQFNIGKYIAQEYQKYIPRYRVDFLVTLSEGGKEKSLILEYDGLEYHTKDPQVVRSLEDFREEYLEYDLRRQLELESYGYHFLRINKFSLLPKKGSNQTSIDVLNGILLQSFDLQ
jgi:superfamily I DNA and/or RNA helicase/very-short-patch-repair endonuclease